MSVRAAVAGLKVKVDTGDPITPKHMKYRTTHVECRSPGFDSIRGKTEGVRLYLGEWDWQHSAVYLAITSRYVLDNDFVAEGCFEEPIRLEQLDLIIDGLIKVRAKGRELGILTPRRIPRTVNSIASSRKAS